MAFKGLYTDDVTDEEIDESDLVSVTVQNNKTKENRTFHVSQETWSDLIDGQVTASELFLAD